MWPCYAFWCAIVTVINRIIQLWTLFRLQDLYSNGKLHSTVQSGFCLSLTSTTENNSKGHQHKVNKRELSGETLFHRNEIHLNNKWTSSRRSGLHRWLPSDETIQCKADWLAPQIWKAIKSQEFFFPIQDRELHREYFHSLKVKENFWVMWESILSSYRTSCKNSLKLAGVIVEGPLCLEHFVLIFLAFSFM